MLLQRVQGEVLVPGTCLCHVLQPLTPSFPSPVSIENPKQALWERKATNKFPLDGYSDGLWVDPKQMVRVLQLTKPPDTWAPA